MCSFVFGLEKEREREERGCGWLVSDVAGGGDIWTAERERERERERR